MLRDEIGGAAVNLVPAEKPQDIYQRVADRTTELLAAAVQAGGDDAPLAQLWLDYGLNRKATKRPTMTLPYGARQFSARQYLEDWVREQGYEGKPHPFGEDLFNATVYLSRVVWQAQGEVVVAARAAMDWLQQCAAVVTRAGIAVSWTTPDGLLVVQPYKDQRERRIETLTCGRHLRLSIKEDTDKIDNRRAVNGVAPNFVHSLDGTALRAWVVAASAAGITNFAVVHDSFGTLAAHTDVSVQLIQSSFVAMYRDNDVIEQFRLAQPADLREQFPPSPPKGTLNIEQVLDSDYFFC